MVSDYIKSVKIPRDFEKQVMLINNKNEFVLDRDVKWPAFVSEKLDGIRCLFYKGVPISRTGKLFPNTKLVHLLMEQVTADCAADDHCRKLLEWFAADGELVAVNNDGSYCDFNTTQSIVMSDSHPDTHKIMFIGFDWHSSAEKFHERLDLLKHSLPATFLFAEQRLCHCVEAVNTAKTELWELARERDHGREPEGFVLKGCDSYYKRGRTTIREGTCFKLVEWETREAVVVGYKQRIENLDTSCKRNDNLIAVNELGALIVQDKDAFKFSGGQFDVGSGFSALERKQLWQKRDTLIGKIIHYKFRPNHVKEVPAPAIFKAFQKV